jgi:hypothetical protein
MTQVLLRSGALEISKFLLVHLIRRKSMTVNLHTAPSAIFFAGLTVFLPKTPQAEMGLRWNWRSPRRI